MDCRSWHPQHCRDRIQHIGRGGPHCHGFHPPPLSNTLASLIFCLAVSSSSIGPPAFRRRRSRSGWVVPVAAEDIVLVLPLLLPVTYRLRLSWWEWFDGSNGRMLHVCWPPPRAPAAPPWHASITSRKSKEIYGSHEVVRSSKRPAMIAIDSPFDSTFCSFSCSGVPLAYNHGSLHV